MLTTESLALWLHFFKDITIFIFFLVNYTSSWLVDFNLLLFNVYIHPLDKYSVEIVNTSEFSQFLLSMQPPLSSWSRSECVCEAYLHRALLKSHQYQDPSLVSFFLTHAVLLLDLLPYSRGAFFS